MNKKEIVEELRKIWQFKCEGCLSDTGGCSCTEDKNKMIQKLIREVVRSEQKRV